MAGTSYSVARRIFEGKIIDVDRQTSQGFTLGSAKITGDGDTGLCTIEFQNENLIARAEGETLAIVPDIISVLDAETAIPITNETVKEFRHLRRLHMLHLSRVGQRTPHDLGEAVQLLKKELPRCQVNYGPPP